MSERSKLSKEERVEYDRRSREKWEAEAKARRRAAAAGLEDPELANYTGSGPISAENYSKWLLKQSPAPKGEPAPEMSDWERDDSLRHANIKKQIREGDLDHPHGPLLPRLKVGVFPPNKGKIVGKELALDGEDQRYYAERSRRRDESSTMADLDVNVAPRPATPDEIVPAAAFDASALIAALTGAFKEEVSGLRSIIVSLKEEVDQLRIDLARETMRQKEIAEASAKAAPSVDPTDALAQLTKELGSLRRKAREDEERRDRLQKERVEREARQAAEKVARAEKAAAEAAIRREKRAAKKLECVESSKAKLARRLEIKAAKAKGENPYTPEETKAYVAKLESKGKTYYTPEQRAAFKAKQAPKSIYEKGKERGSKPGFRVYTADQKAEFVRKNFTDRGLTYYTAEERKKYKAEKRAAQKKRVVAVVS